MGDLHGDPVLSPLRCLFFFGAAYTGILFFFRCAVCFFKFAFGRFIRGLPFFLYSATCSFLGEGVRFFSAFNAVLFCTFVVGRVVRLCFLLYLGAGAPVWVCRQLAL